MPTGNLRTALTRNSLSEDGSIATKVLQAQDSALGREPRALARPWSVGGLAPVARSPSASDIERAADGRCQAAQARVIRGPRTGPAVCFGRKIGASVRGGSTCGAQPDFRCGRGATSRASRSRSATASPLWRRRRASVPHVRSGEPPQLTDREKLGAQRVHLRGRAQSQHKNAPNTEPGEPTLSPFRARSAPKAA